MYIKKKGLDGQKKIILEQREILDMKKSWIIHNGLYNILEVFYDLLIDESFSVERDKIELATYCQALI